MMSLKRILILSFSLFLGMSVYSQSKLINAGKTGKLSGTTVKVKSEPKKPKTPTTPPKKETPSPTTDPYKSVGYMEISGISFANIDNSGTIIDDFGADLYAGDLKYLKPKIFYKGLSTSTKEITLYIKIIKEDGTIMSGTNSPEGYTFKNDVKIESGVGKSLELLGWGNNLAATYSAGQYKCEIWYNGNILFQKGFRLYSGTTPLVGSKLIKINNLKLGNVNKSGDVITGYGQELIENEIQYLQPQISYEGLSSNEQNVTFMVRITLANGNICKGNSSPLGFTFKNSFVIKPGYNTATLLGWGNEAKNTYKNGTCKYEIWLDGNKIYETNFTVSEKSTSTMSPVSSSYSSSSSINDFFPLWGITLGKTTWNEAENLGHTVKIWKEGPDRYVDVQNVDFWDHDGIGRFTSLYWTHSEADFPYSWKSKGFSWENSYDRWLDVFRNLGFTINVTKEPVTGEFSGHKTLSADVEAVSTDGLLELDLDFDYGEDGHYTFSPKTLYSITIRYKGK